MRSDCISSRSLLIFLLCIKSYGLVGKMSCIVKLIKSYITSRNSTIK